LDNRRQGFAQKTAGEQAAFKVLQTIQRFGVLLLGGDGGLDVNIIQ
jgi:hypothetical protein